jgi:hypothetical protein
MAQQPLLGQGLLIVEASRSHWVWHTTLGRILWTSDQPDAETSTWLHTTLKTDRHPCPQRDFFLHPACPLIHFVPSNPSLLLHVTYAPYYCPYTRNTTQTSMPPLGFEPTIPASERPQTHTFDRAATRIGRVNTALHILRQQILFCAFCSDLRRGLISVRFPWLGSMFHPTKWLYSWFRASIAL